MTTTQTEIQTQEYQVNVGDESIYVRKLRLADGTECMIVADVAEMCGVTAAGLRSIIRDHGLSVRSAHEHQLAELKKQGAIPLKTPTVNLLPRDTIEALVKIINTPQAWAVYKQLWADARQLQQLVDAGVTKRGEVSSGIITSLRHALDALSGLATEVAEVRELATQADAKAGESALTADQVGRLGQAMAIRCAELGYRNHTRHTAGGCMRRELKEKFLPRGVRGQLKWTDIRQADFTEAMRFVTHWDFANRRAPTEG